MYKDIDKKEYIRGLKIWKNKFNKFTVAMLHYTADPDKDPERNGKDWVAKEKEGTLKATWLKEYEIDFTTKSGKLIFGPEYCDYNKSIHLIDSFEIPEPYELMISLDFGQSNPTAALIGAIDSKDRIYIIDEYYKPNIPSRSSKEMMKQFAYLTKQDLSDKSIRQKRDIMINTFTTRVIDPSTKSKNRVKQKQGEEIPYSIIEEFWDNGWDFEPGNNDVRAGITRIREYFQLDNNQEAHLYIFKDKCPNLIWELDHYRYRELSEKQLKTSNKSEEPVKKDDHAIDALRYMLMARPYSPLTKPKPKTKIQKDIERLLQPKIIYDDWDYS